MIDSAVWGAVIAIAVVTYISRILMLLPSKSTARLTFLGKYMDVLGPCLLSSVMASVIVPEYVHARATNNLIPFAVGLLFATGATAIRRDPGLATAAGVIGWWTTDQLLSTMTG